MVDKTTQFHLTTGMYHLLFGVSMMICWSALLCTCCLHLCMHFRWHSCSGSTARTGHRCAVVVQDQHRNTPFAMLA